MTGVKFTMFLSGIGRKNRKKEKTKEGKKLVLFRSIFITGPNDYVINLKLTPW